MAAVPLAVRPNAEDLWRTALANLSDEDKSALALGGTGTDRLDAITQSLKLADDAARKCKEKAWRFRRKNGGEVIARDVFAKIARWINHFKAVGDIVAQYDPVHAILPWAGVRFVLQVCVDYFETHDFLLEKITHVAEHICRCRIIEKHIIRFSSPAVDELRRAIIKLYAAILTFLAQVKAYFQQTTKMQFLKSLKYVSSRFNGAFQAIVTAQAEMERYLQMTNAQEQVNRLIALKDELARLEQPMARWSNELAKITDNLDRSKRTEILRWISSEPYLRHHKRERETFLEGTGNWLISHSTFQKWKDESASSLLWLHGIPGSGKSKLTSLVIEDAVEAFKKQQAPSPAYFYCSRNPIEPGRSDPEKILASIVRQFSSPGPGKPLLPSTVKTYQSYESEGFSCNELQFQDSYKLLLEVLLSYPTATIIIDALDECRPETRQKLLDKLEDILRESPTLVKIFVSSRDDQDITYKLRYYPALELSSDLNSVDIDRFVECETKLLIRQGRLLQSSNRKDEISQIIIKDVSSGACGMFRWADLQLAALCDLVTEKAILERLGRLPPTLKDLYQEILDKVQHYSAEADRIYTENALAWLLCSQRRLDSSEFLAAISTTNQLTEPISKDQVLRLCRNLVIFDSTVDSFRFAHLSVREFLEAQPSYRTSAINSIAARCCLTTLMTCNDTAQTSCLHSYASWCWAPHCEDAADEREMGPLQMLLEEFLSNTAPQSPFEAWNRYKFASDRIMYHYTLYYKLFGSQNSEPSSLYIASIFNFAEVIRSIAQPQTNLKILQRCVFLAVRWNAIGALNVLLGLNEDVITEKVLGARACSQNCSEGVMALLLERGGRAKITENVLTAAASNEHKGEMIMALLLEKSSQVQITENVLTAAASNKHKGEMIMALLLEKSSQVQITENVLTAAASNKHKGEMIMAVLLEKGSQVQITEDVLKVAAGNRDWKVMALLLKERGDQVKITEEVVKAAALKGRLEVMALLLKERGDQIEITEEVVKAAAGNSDWEVMALLFKEKGDQVEITKELVNTPEVYGNWRKIALLLKERGDQVGIIEEVVEAVTAHGHCDVMAVLLKKRGDQVKITENVVVAAASRYSDAEEFLALFFKERGDQVEITENVVVAAAGNHICGDKVLALLFKERGDQVKITENVVVAAAGNIFCSERALALFFKERGDQVEITKGVLKAAAGNVGTGEEVMALLLEQRNNQGVVTEGMRRV